MGASLCATTRGWSPSHPYEGATFLALVVSVTDRTELRPLMEGSVRASTRLGSGTALDEC
jgi:hypothetical protein